MDTMLSFSLLLIQNFSQQGFRKYDCNVQIYSEIFPKITRSMSVIMKEGSLISFEIVETPMKKEPSRNHTVVALQCSGTHGPMQVYLIVSEKTRRDKSKVTYLLQSLKLNADQDENDCAAKCCFVSEDHERRSQSPAKVRLTGKVFLPGVSNCSISSNQSKENIFSGKEQTMNDSCIKEISGKIIPEYRRKKSIYVKIAILCVMFPVVLAIMIFGVCEVPLPDQFPCKGDHKDLEKYKVGNEKKEDLTSEIPGPSTMVKA